jgi:hypothetical protein
MIALLIFCASLDAATAGAELERLQHELAKRGKPETMAALDRLADDAPDTEASGRALVWLGDLARQGNDIARAEKAYGRAATRGGDVGRLGERGLGDVALLQHAYRAARTHYDRAARGAPPLLAAELAEKHTLASRLEARRLAAYGCVGVVALALLWFAARIRRRGPPLAVPTELIYVLPVYALLVAGSWGLDPNVLHALSWCALSSLVVIAFSALAAMRAPVRPWLHIAVLGAANAALFYTILWRTQLLDPLITTAAP